MTKPHMSNPRARSEIRAKTSAIARIERREERSSTRLTDVERAERRVTGGELQLLITDLASALGWNWMEVGPLRTERGWRTATRGTLGKGWPDLTLVRERDRRLIFAELKRELGDDLSVDQRSVLEVLGSLHEDVYDSPILGRVDLRRHPNVVTVEVHVWRPSDLRDPIETSRIYEVLR